MNKSIVNIIIFVLLLFFYFFSVQFIGIPLATRTFLGLLGCLALFFKRHIQCSLFRPLSGLLLYFAIIIFVSVVNINIDTNFIADTLLYLLYFFGSYFLIFVLPFRGKNGDDPATLIKLIVLVIALHSLVSLVLFLIPDLNQFVRSFLYFSETDINRMEGQEQHRMIGFILSYFGAGALNGLALILISYLFLSNAMHRKTLWAILYVFILTTGILLARTVLIGFIISICFIIIWKRKSMTLLWLKLKWGVIISILVVSGVGFLYVFVDENVLMWAFEIFINLHNSGELSSSSLSIMMDMYKFPSDLDTWIFGDGRYVMTNGRYYMDTDIGFCRLLFYGGVPITLAFFYIQYCFIREINKFNHSELLKALLKIIFLYTVILNLKGHIDYISFYALVYMWMCAGNLKKI